ncbi:PREDICTED: golgin subfamily A member 2-like [Elephantulus edwardii]|uniref:golgin subfamily A member 2-like n=1 Tax=Elephantulus edwardii TaxID=28737 RepID=UPI0003F092BB|nr:PREDICTED: golgin subfamily A member 2-like [Elephantulus edwardii]
MAGAGEPNASEAAGGGGATGVGFQADGFDCNRLPEAIPQWLPGFVRWAPITPPLPAMSEENRNRKLVRARKKLKEFQKKRTSALSPGAKDTKNIKNGGSPKRTTLGGCSTPEIQDILKVLVSNFNCSNGVVLSALDKWKDKKEFETKIAQEEGCLRHQLEVHIQTIGILISEKSDLRSALYHTQNAVKAKTGELEDVAAHLKASQQRVEKLERAISAVAKEKNILNKYKKELLKERDSLLVQVLKQSCTNETLTKKNVELERELQTVENDLKTLREELDAPECKIQQVLNLKEEKELSLAKIQELESQLTVLKEEKAFHSPDNPPSGSLKNEERLHAELDCLKKQLSDQRNDYEMMILQYQSREHHLHELEHVEERWRELESLRPAILETLEASQNGDLKDQLKELQESFVKLTNDKLELTNTLQAEQHIKKELTKKIDELQKNVEELKKMVKTKNTQVENLQEERDLYYRYLQLYIVTYQQYAVLYQHLISDQGTLHKINQELQRTQEKLATVEERNQQLEAQIRDLAIPREGEDMLVKDADVAPSVLNSQGALAVMSQKEQAQHGGQEPDVEVRDRPNPEPSPSEVKDNVLGEKYRVLQEAMEKLQGRFIDVMKDKVELQERLEYLEHRCIQLPGKSASIGDYAALYLNNRAQLKEHHQAKEEGIGPVAQHKDDVKK